MVQERLPRLQDLPAPARWVLSAFLAMIGVGYVVAAINIYVHHQDADLEPGFSLDDLRRVYHGIDTETSAEHSLQRPSVMEKMVRPGGGMRKYLEKGGDSAVRAMMCWLESGATQTDFTKTGKHQPGDPSAQQVLGSLCIRCHNATDGEAKGVAYAESATAEPEYRRVAEFVAPRAGLTEHGTHVVHLAPTEEGELVQVTHAHILAIPVFTLIISGLFFLTGLSPAIKRYVGPAPMIALCCDFASWWLARLYEPFVYVIVAAGAVFGICLAFQIVAVLVSLWSGRRAET